MSEIKQFYVEISELCVRMNARYPFVYRHCHEYRIPAPDRFDVDAVVTDAEIAREMTLYDAPHSEAYCEDICLYRSIAEQLPARDRFVFHGAAVDIGGRGFIFTAPSGTGKTTHIDLLMKNYPDGVSIINGDKPIIHVKEDGARVCSTPWAGKENMQKNVIRDLGGIVILHRGAQNSIRRIEPGKYFSEIMAQVYMPFDPMARLATFELMDKLAKCVPFYLLECNISSDAAKTSFEALIK